MEISRRWSKAVPKLVLVILTVFLVVNTFSSVAKADRGGFSPRRVQVSETDQRAIIAWNGTYEALILSTDVASVNESEVVEIMPLPSNPTISNGEAQSFEQVATLVNSFFDVTINSRIRYNLLYGWQPYDRQSAGPWRTQSVWITFQETIGLHFLTVVKAENSTDLTQWLRSFLESRGYNSDLPTGLEDLASKYIQDEIRYFVIDMIKTNSTTKTVDPLVYQFQTSKLYYPLRISTLFSGYTSISLFTVTKNQIKEDSVFGGKFRISAQFQIKREACTSVCANFTELFSDNPYMYYLTYYGPQKDFSEDMNAEVAQSRSDTSTVVAASMGLVFGLTVLFFAFAPRIESALGLEIPANRRWKIGFLLTGLVGLGLVWVGFFYPWGLATYGGVLFSVDGTFATSQSNLGFFYVLFLLSAVVCYVYLGLIAGYSKIAATHFTVMGGSTMLMSGITSAISLRTLGTGMYLTVTGCAFLGLAGFISLRRLRLEPVPRYKMASFRTYVIRRFLISMLTLFAVFVIIFYLLSLAPLFHRVVPF
jgi:hypothetical protein